MTEQMVIPIPLNDGAVGTVLIPMRMTAAEWERMQAILEAYRPHIVPTAPTDPAALPPGRRYADHVHGQSVGGAEGAGAPSPEPPTAEAPPPPAGAPAEGTKRCKTCSQDKPLEEFNRNKTAKDGLQYSCKACVREYQKGYNLRKSKPGGGRSLGGTRPRGRTA